MCFWFKMILYLKLCMLVDVLGSLSVEDKLRFIGHSNYMILHGMTKESRMKKKRGKGI